MITIDKLTIINAANSEAVDFQVTTDDSQMNESCITTSVAPVGFEVTFSGNTIFGNQ
jgi:hypothetical protein